jgi:hypothetical protein
MLSHHHLILSHYMKIFLQGCGGDKPEDFDGLVMLDECHKGTLTVNWANAFLSFVNCISPRRSLQPRPLTLIATATQQMLARVDFALRPLPKLLSFRSYSLVPALFTAAQLQCQNPKIWVSCPVLAFGVQVSR